MKTINNYIKSPLNFTGGKYKLLPQILPLFPENIHTFIDLFGGGFNVGINVNADKIVYNDSEEQIVELLKYLHKFDIEDLLYQINYYINYYNLSNKNKDGYLQLRKDYNSSEYKNPIMLYILICHGFNNQIRFNSKDEYNIPFGERCFNIKLRENFINFHKKLEEINCSFFNICFAKFNFSDLLENDFIYCDPPYFNSIATYNENNGWTDMDENDLLYLLDNLNEKNIKFALSNNLKYNNPILNEWKDKYNIYYLNADYSNCNHQKKDKSKDIEVLITNY